MAISKLHLLFLISVILSLHRPVLSDIEAIFLTGINDYRTSLNLTPLTENKNLECLADEIIDQIKNQPCPNSPDTTSVPFSVFPNLLTNCRLNPTVLTYNATFQICNDELNEIEEVSPTEYAKKVVSDSKFTDIGIGSGEKWAVAFITTSTPEQAITTSTPEQAQPKGAGHAPEGGVSPATHSGAFTFGVNTVVASSFMFLLFCSFTF